VDGKAVKHDHRQLTSEFIAYRLSNQISSLPTMSIKTVMELVKALFHYDVKYGKAWKVKQAAFRMLYGDWEEAYNRIPRLLLAIADANPGMVHVLATAKMVRRHGRMKSVWHILLAAESGYSGTHASEHLPMINPEGRAGEPAVDSDTNPLFSDGKRCYTLADDILGHVH
jgi:hypothetical protein